MQQERESCRRCASSSKATGVQRGARTGTPGSGDMAPRQHARCHSPTAVLGTTDAAICNIPREGEHWPHHKRQNFRAAPNAEGDTLEAATAPAAQKRLQQDDAATTGSHERTKPIPLCVVRPISATPAPNTCPLDCSPVLAIACCQPLPTPRASAPRQPAMTCATSSIGPTITAQTRSDASYLLPQTAFSALLPN